MPDHGAGPDDPPGRHLDRVADPGREEYIGSTCGGLMAAVAAVDNGAIWMTLAGCAARGLRSVKSETGWRDGPTKTVQPRCHSRASASI